MSVCLSAGGNPLTAPSVRPFLFSEPAKEALTQIKIKNSRTGRLTYLAHIGRRSVVAEAGRVDVYCRDRDLLLF